MLVSFQGTPRIVVNRSDFLGPASVDLVGPPRRLYSDGAPALPLLENYVDEARVEALTPPAAQLSETGASNWLARSSQALAMLRAAFLLGEDPRGRLTSRQAATLAHQVSLVRHVLTRPELNRVMIADEVGLGKTIEAGLIIQGLLEQQPGLRILYLAPARLVRNVAREFRVKLDLAFRTWSADRAATADLESDQLVVASIHRAVNPLHREGFVEQQQWDVLIVDEAHHLTAIGAEGKYSNRHFQLVRKLAQALPEHGRLLLMTGTPHQGNRLRFENLVSLLRQDGEGSADALQKVIFRTKEDVRDWAGHPLFPGRQVNAPHVVSLGHRYRRWYEDIGSLYDGVGGSGQVQRASAWAKGQALQWAASSVEAGLGFLVRMSMRRLRWDARNATLRSALAALRPYRFGPPDEPIDVLFERLRKEVARQSSDADVEDLEEDAEEKWMPDADLLASLIAEGVALLEQGTGAEKWQVLAELLKSARDEKVVVFSQPIETVGALVTFLERELGEQPAVVVGGQTDDERDAQIRAFWKAGGPRVLVSSRAGGEGINLQVARRLVHLDVPWNPMEMEQRVGRVHRFGSRNTILVDTIVVEGTREVDAYRIAREKLRLACGDLADDPARFEALFSRVMSVVPPDEFEAIVCSGSAGSLVDADRLGTLVEQGLHRWQEFHDDFARQQNAIEEVAPGSAGWDDLFSFAVQVLNAETVEGYSVPVFDNNRNGGAVGRSVRAVRIGGRVYVCDDTFGFAASNSDGETAPLLGLNTPVVTEALRRLWSDCGKGGAAYLRAPDAATAAELRSLLDIADQCVISAYVRQDMRVRGGVALEEGVSFHLAVSDRHSEGDRLITRDAARIVRALLACTRQKSPGGEVPVRVATERTIRSIAKLTRDEFADGVRRAVWPVFSAVIDLSAGSPKD